MSDLLLWAMLAGVLGACAVMVAALILGLVVNLAATRSLLRPTGAPSSREKALSAAELARLAGRAELADELEAAARRPAGALAAAERQLHDRDLVRDQVELGDPGLAGHLMGHPGAPGRARRDAARLPGGRPGPGRPCAPCAAVRAGIARFFGKVL